MGQYELKSSQFIILEDKFASLLVNTSRGVTREIKDGFGSTPKGCYIQLEKISAKHILENIRASCGNTAGIDCLPRR